MKSKRLLEELVKPSEDAEFDRAWKAYAAMFEDASGSATSGAFYVAPLPGGKWKLFAARRDKFGDELHSAWWEDVISLIMAQIWARELNVSRSWLHTQLRELPYAVPRGRVVVDGDGWSIGNEGIKQRIWWGRDFTDSMVRKAEIESAFSLARPTWAFDEHEQCTRHEATVLCGALGIPLSWPVR